MFGLPDLVFGIFALLMVGASWCLVGIIFGDAPKRGVETALIQFTGAVATLLVGSCIAFFFMKPTPCGTKEILFTCATLFCGNFVNYFGLQAMSAGMRRGPNGAVWGIMQSALIFPYMVGLLLFAQAITVPNLAGIILVGIALVFFTMAKNQQELQPATAIRKSWRFYALLALAITALQQNISTAPSAYFESPKLISPILRSLCAAGGTLFAACIWIFVRYVRDRNSAGEMFSGLKNPWLYLYVLGMLPFNLFLAYVLLYPGLDAMGRAGAGSVCYPLMVGSCIVSFSLYSILKLREKVTALQISAIVLCLIGLSGLCFPKTFMDLPLRGYDIVPWLKSLGGY